MRPTLRAFSLVLLGLVLGVTAALMWPRESWTYYRDPLMRIDRRTGVVEHFTQDSGWVTLRRKPNPFADLVPP